MDDLLGNAEPAGQVKGHSSAARGREFLDWIPGEGGPLTLPGGTSTQTGFNHLGTPDDSRNDERLGNEQARRGHPVGFDTLLMREGELMSKLHDLLHSPMGAGVARIVDDLHGMIGKGRNSP